jgi:hypothetical protein
MKFDTVFSGTLAPVTPIWPPMLTPAKTKNPKDNHTNVFICPSCFVFRTMTPDQA